MNKRTEQQIADDNKHISTDEIKQDILDTQIEISTMEQELKAYSILKDRMSMMRVSARKSGIKERKGFIKKLEAILKIRNKK